jgi:hypothetical protein
MIPRVVSVELIEENEAVLELSDGSLQVFVFSHPNRLKVGDYVRAPLRALLVKDAVATQPGDRVERMNPSLAHRITGTVSSLNPAGVRVGEIEVLLDDPLPGDCGVGMAVSFVCERLDIG